MKKTGLKHTIFGIALPVELEAFLRDNNPWWENKPMKPLPPFRRWFYERILRSLKTGLAPITSLRGPRQVGKTTLMEQIIHNFLYIEGMSPKRIFHVQFDEIPSLKDLVDPILTLCRWFEERILGGTYNEFAIKGEPVYIFFDEVQNLSEWAPQVKALVDHHSVKVFLTGSSAPRMEIERDSLAGKVSTLEINTLFLREIASLRGWGDPPPFLPSNGLKVLQERNFWEDLREYGIKNYELRDKTFETFSERGGYPIAQVKIDHSWEEIADYLNETIIRRVIHHHLRIGERGKKRDERLLEEVFRLSCRYAGQSPGKAILINELKSAFSVNIGWERILAYLKFLNDTLLIRLVEPLEIRLKKQKRQPKLCLCDHALRRSWLQEYIPITHRGLQDSLYLSDLAGHVAESITGYFLSNIPGLDIAWFPERGAEPEVDFVIKIGEQRVPMEIKYRKRIDGYRDTFGLRSFLEKSVYNAPFGILVTLSDNVSVIDPRIICLPLSTLLLMK